MCTCYYLQPETERLKGINNRINRSSLYDKYIRAGDAVLTSGEIKPGNVVPVIAPNRKGEMSVFPMRWGFGSPGMILLANARLESIRETEVFKDSWRNHRCIVPASWFYEWKLDPEGFGQKTDKNKYMVQPMGEMETWLCGLYRFEGGFPVFSVITGKAKKGLKKINDRMPIMMPKNLIKEWIRPEARPDELLGYALTEMIIEKA